MLMLDAEGLLLNSQKLHQLQQQVAAEKLTVLFNLHLKNEYTNPNVSVCQISNQELPGDTATFEQGMFKQFENSAVTSAMTQRPVRVIMGCGKGESRRAGGPN